MRAQGERVADEDIKQPLICGLGAGYVALAALTVQMRWDTGYVCYECRAMLTTGWSLCRDTELVFLGKLRSPSISTYSTSLLLSVAPLRRLCMCAVH